LYGISSMTLTAEWIIHTTWWWGVKICLLPIEICEILYLVTSCIHLSHFYSALWWMANWSTSRETCEWESGVLCELFHDK
jgi:hypothetical protein